MVYVSFLDRMELVPQTQNSDNDYSDPDADQEKPTVSRKRN